MASPSRRVLITGASGFTGRWLGVRLAQAGYQVYGLTQEPARSPAEIQADLCDSPALRAALETARPDYIVHLAAITFVHHLVAGPNKVSAEDEENAEKLVEGRR